MKQDELEKARGKLYKKQRDGCSASKLTYIGWYCRGQFSKECKAENCFVVDFALSILSDLEIKINL